MVYLLAAGDVDLLLIIFFATFFLLIKQGSNYTRSPFRFKLDLL